MPRCSENGDFAFDSLNAGDPDRPPLSPAAAGVRLLELRKGKGLPAGMTLKELIAAGRA